MCAYIYIYIIEGSLEVKLPTIWTDKKQRWEEQEKRREEKRREEERRKKKEERRSKRGSLRLRRKRIQAGDKVAIHCRSGGSESRLAKAAGAEPCGRKVARCCGAKHVCK